jgi:hypothetical protein
MAVYRQPAQFGQQVDTPLDAGCPNPCFYSSGWLFGLEPAADEEERSHGREQVNAYEGGPGSTRE